jgi:hypothetical protein
MCQTSSLLSFVFCSCALSLLAGCSGGPGSVSSPTVTVPPVSPTPPSTPPVTRITQPSVYVVTDDPSPESVLVFPLTASGSTSTTPLIEGSNVSVDGDGNIYVLSESGSSIDVYPVDSPNGTPVRSLPVGPGTKISSVQDVMASATGEIFVSDGKGIAVFSPTATGNADPVRYIVGSSASGAPIIPGIITVDGSDTLYVQNVVDSSIAVFGPTDNGNVIPLRTIVGPLNSLSGNYTAVAMATDAQGNLYELNGDPFVVFEFDPEANGRVAPIRSVWAPSMYPYFFNNSLALDSAGNIYLSTGEALTPSAPTSAVLPAVFVFSPSASGNVTPSSIITSPEWLDAPTSRIAVH